MDNSDFGKIDFSFPFDDYTHLHSQGSTSDCYKVRINGKWHFLKRPKKELSRNPFYLSAFEKEFDLGFNLEHPNIVRYINKGKDKEGTYFITEFIDGFTLDEFVKQHPDYFKQRESVEKFTAQLLSAISYLHGKQILHLDLKPQNILITRIDYNVKLIDLGFSYSDCYQTLTIGKTDLYASPEQIRNEEIDQRTDIYGIGMVLLYLFTQTSNIASLSQVPSKYRAIIKKCLNEEIGGRYFNVSSLDKAIAQASKTKYLGYGLALVLLIGVGLFFFFNPTIEREEKAQGEIKVVPDTLVFAEEIQDEADTIKVVEDPDSVVDKKPIMPKEEKEPLITSTEKPELPKRSINQNGIYYDEEGDEISIDTLKAAVKLVIGQQYDMLFSRELSPIDIVDEYKFQEIEYAHQTLISNCNLLLDTLHTVYPMFPIEEIIPIQNWIASEIRENMTRYNDWLRRYCREHKSEIEALVKEKGIVKDVRILYLMDEL